jgi:elongation factor P
MIETGDLKKGSTIEIDGNLYQVIELDHIKMGRGSAQVRMKLRDLRAGHIIDKSVQAGARFTRARVERSPAQYLVENGECNLLMYGTESVGIELPAAVELKVKIAEPAVRGDTAQGGTKPVTMETGLQVNVPMFIEVGDTLKIDTRTGAYLSRA